MLSLSLVVVIFGEQNLRIFVLGWEWFHCAVLLWGAWSWSWWSWCLLLYLFRPPIIRPSVYRKVTALWSVHVPSCFSCVQLCDPVDCSPPGSSVHGVSRQQYWGGLPCPPPGDLPDPGTEPGSAALQADSLPLALPGEPHDPWDDPSNLVLPASVGLEVSMTRGLSPCI